VAAIEDLIAQVTDPDLRMRLQAAVRSLKEHKRFGLVFEEHIPEVVAIPGIPVAAGDTVMDRTDADGGLYRVTKLLTRTAHIEPVAGGEVEKRRLADLDLVRRFGEPTYPALLPIGTVGTRPAEARTHGVICGENYHALQMLLYLHRGQVDCIYIDPPYNTGDRSWKYNNRYVDSNDAWRHSKWLAMMEKRLVLGRRLLRPNGTLVVTIDEHEVNHLGMLLERVFPDADRQMVTIVNNPKGVTRPGTVRFSRVEEYAFFCFLGDARVTGRGDDFLTPGISEDDPVTSVGRRPRWKGLLRSGTNARRADRIHMFYPVLIDPERGAVLGTGDPLYDVDPDPDEPIDGLSAAWPIRSDGSWGNWGVGPATLRTLIGQGFVAVGSYDARRRTWPLTYLSEDLRAQLAAGVLKVASFDEKRNVVEVLYTEEGSRRLKTVWHRTRHDAGVGGSDVLRSLLGSTRMFDFPKSVYAVRDTLSALTRHKPDALILDFFAGSGTTLHATLMLNAEDGGRRRCVLVTNNEVDDKTGTRLRKQKIFPGDDEWEAHGVFEAVARPRCEAAVTGRRRADGEPIEGTYVGGRPIASGFEEAVEFYRLTYVDPDEVDLGWQFEAVLPALWLRAGAVGDRPEFKPDASMVIPKGTNFGVLFNEAFIRQFARQVADNSAVTHAYLVTDSLEAFAEMRALLRAGLDVSMLYRDYLRSFAINVEAET
jgi:adenine-specific DNA-methyltransferase